MNKEEIQKKVLQNRNLLDLDKFSCDEKTETFSTDENNLVLNFKDAPNTTFNTYDSCTFKTCWNCAFDIRVMGYFINNHNTNNNIVVVKEFDSYKRYKLYELNNLPKEFLSLEIDKVTVKEKENE